LDRNDFSLVFLSFFGPVAIIRFLARRVYPVQKKENISFFKKLHDSAVEPGLGFETT